MNSEQVREGAPA
jgi:hypothetical protein